MALIEYMKRCHALCIWICLALNCNMLTKNVTFDSVCMQSVQRWVHRCRPSLPGPAAKLLHLPHHDVMACPDSSPDAEAPRAMSLEPEADLAADDIQHGQISSDSAANALATSLPCESPASHPLVLGAAALALSMLGDSSSAAAISAPEALGAPAADTVNPANIAETRLAAPSGDCEEYEQAELEESDELCQADNAPGISTLASCRFSFSSMPHSICMAVLHTVQIVVCQHQGKHYDPSSCW